MDEMTAQFDKLRPKVTSQQKAIDNMHKKIDDGWKSFDRKKENEEFNRRVEEGKAEWDAMQEEIKTSEAAIKKLKEDGAKLTDAEAIKKNSRAVRMEESDVEYAKERATELKAEYDALLDEKKTRDEEWAFQEQIDKV